MHHFRNANHRHITAFADDGRLATGERFGNLEIEDELGRGGFARVYRARDTVLGSNLALGEAPQAIVPVDAWQSARTTGDWTLVGCTVSPGFRFEGFELAPPGFDIPPG